MKNDDEKQGITECQLEDGTIVQYDMALNEKDNPAPLSQEWLHDFGYIGCGRIYRINGRLQTYSFEPQNLRYFYKRVKRVDVALDYMELLRASVAEAVLEEREACAELATTFYAPAGFEEYTARAIAEAIRAKGKEK